MAVVDLVLDVDVDLRGAGEGCSPHSCLSCSRDVFGEVVAVKGAAVAAAAAAASKGERLEEDVAAAVAAAAAIVAAIAATCLEVIVHEGCDVETKAKAEASKPRGKRGCSP